MAQNGLLKLSLKRQTLLCCCFYILFFYVSSPLYYYNVDHTTTITSMSDKRSKSSRTSSKTMEFNLAQLSLDLQGCCCCQYQLWLLFRLFYWLFAADIKTIVLQGFNINRIQTADNCRYFSKSKYISYCVEIIYMFSIHYVRMNDTYLNKYLIHMCSTQK